MNGGGNNDILKGGAGKDTLTGLAGNQAFSFIGTAAFSTDATGQLRFDAVNNLV